jgi:hypothetical protein
MELNRFVAEAADVGIAHDPAAALHARLYGAPRTESAADLLADARPALAEQTALSRVVQACIWVGVLLVIGAHAWWSTSAYESSGIGGVLLLTLMWQGGFLLAAEWAHRRGFTALVAGFAAAVAFYAPLTAYCVLRTAGASFDDDFEGFYEWVSEGWIGMDVAAIAAAAGLYQRYRRPFILLPLCLFASFLAMDGGLRLVGEEHLETFVAAGGVVLILVGAALDRQGVRREAFWPHLVGLGAVAWGLPTCGDHVSAGLLGAAAVALVAGISLARATHLAAGGLLGWAGLAVAASDAGDLFPFALMLPGLAVIGLAIWLATVDSAARRWLHARHGVVRRSADD